MAWIDCTYAMTGKLIESATIEIGIAGDSDKYLKATNVKDSVGMTFGNKFDGSDNGTDIKSNATLVVATIRTTGANVCSIESGNVTVHLNISTVPGV
jgi:hypothetical protein